MKLNYVEDNAIYKVSSDLPQWDNVIVQIKSQPVDPTRNHVPMDVLKDNGHGLLEDTVLVNMSSRVGMLAEFTYLGTREECPEYFL